MKRGVKMNFGRLISAMVTPFDENLNINYDILPEFVDYLIENGNESLVVCGTTGESPALDHDEKIKLFEAVVDASNGRVPIIAGTGTYSTKESIELSKEAKKAGAEGLLLVVPYYNKPPQYALYEHFKSIVEEVNLPSILYNIPGRTSRNMEPETIINLSKLDNIIGVKEASRDMDQVSAIKAGVDEDFKIYSGDDSMTLPMLGIGGYGVISVASQVIGHEIGKMIDEYVKGNVVESASLHIKLFKIFRTMFVNTNPIPLKEALNLMGWKVGTCRPPLYELQGNEKMIVEHVLKDNNLI